MRSAFQWAADKLLTVLFGPAETCPDYPPTVRKADVPCPCGCGLTMGQRWELEL